MKYSAAIVLASVAAGVSAQGAPSGLKPSGSPPAGCVTSAPGRYVVQNVKPMAKRDLQKRVVDCASLKSPLIVTLQNSELHDSAGRIGEIVANRQFQFDGPPAQVGTIYDAGFSMCSNGSLAIGSSTVFYQCLSGGFYNIYDQPVGAGCMIIEQQLLMCADSTGTVTTSAASTSSSSAAVVATQSDGQPTASSATTVVSQVSDGQPQATSAVVSQVSDGQPQATSASNATVTTKAPIPTGAAAQYGASGAVAILGAIAAYLL